MSPILLRPVREQLEHDRVIRLLFARARRRYHAGMNPGAELNVPVGTGDETMYPDLVLASPERGHRLQVVVEVETGESVNNLEALSEWARLGRMRAAFHLYVPSGAVEAARRLCDEHGIVIEEIWSYHPIGDQMRFTLAHRAPVVKRAAASRAKHAARPRVQHKAKERPKRTAGVRAHKRARASARPRRARKGAGRSTGTRRARK